MSYNINTTNHTGQDKKKIRKQNLSHIPQQTSSADLMAYNIIFALFIIQNFVEFVKIVSLKFRGIEMNRNVTVSEFVNFRGAVESICLIPEDKAASPRYKEICFDVSGEICVYFDNELSEYVGIRFNSKE